MDINTLLLIILYVRVSSDGQNVAMQLAAAESYLKDVPEEQKIILIDDGVSAIKNKMGERPKLRELVELIRAGKVGTLIVYDRDRLARDVYEYLEIVRLLYDHQVKVIFTATNVRPFDRSFVVEAVGAIMAAQEGQTIVRRRSDAQKQFPSSLLGYERHKSEMGKVTFTHSKEAVHLLEFFSAVAECQTVEDFQLVLMEFKRVLRRKETRLIGILRTPFYCGCWERDGELLKLDHVEAIISVSLYKKVEQRLQEFKAMTTQILAPHVNEAYVPPHCGLCGKPLKYRRDRLQNESRYYCTSHRKISVPAQQIGDVIHGVLHKKMQVLDVETVVSECSLWLRTHQAKAVRKKRDLEEKLNRCTVRIVTNYGQPSSETTIQELLEEQQKLEQSLVQLQMKTQTYDLLQAQVNLLGDLVVKYLKGKLSKEHELQNLAEMLIRRIEIYPKRMQITVNFSDFFRTGGDIDEVS